MKEIYYSKTKYFFAFIGCVMFTLGGLWIVLSKDMDVSVIGKIVGGYGSLVFFGFGVLVTAYVCFISPKKIGLQIDDKGITIFSAVLKTKPPNIIDWKEIEGFEETSVFGEKMIAVKVSNPKQHIEKQTNALMRKAAQVNFDMIGTPYALTANTYKISHKKLLSLLNEKLQNSKNKKTNA